MRYSYPQVYQELVLSQLESPWVRARARRSMRRLGMYSELALARLHLKTMRRISQGLKIRTMHRDLLIVPSMVGHSVSVHNGLAYIPVQITTQKVGTYLGSYAMPKKALHKHTSKTKAKLDKK